MSAAAAPPRVNGFVPPVPVNLDEVAEYEKILKLRDEIFAGTHPRLRVPAHAIRKVSPVSTNQLSTALHTNVPPPFIPTARQPQLPGLGLNDEEPVTQGPAKNATGSVQPTSTASGIDPVLLTKADVLVRAETQLLRQKLEKSLRDQFEQKRLDGRKRPAAGEGKPDFDVLTVLNKALEIAKPDHASTPKDDESVSSYDENSLYSSKAPDSTPEAGELEDSNSSQNQSFVAEATGANGPAEVRANFAQNIPSAVPPQADVSRLRSGRMSSPMRTARTGNEHHSGPIDVSGDNEDDEEGEYSPPEAMEPYAAPQDFGAQPLDPRSRPLRRYSGLDDGARIPGSPNEGNVRIVRNHITSPVAPQPSRISPLAVAKDSMILQNTRTRTGRTTQRGRGEQSPEAPDQGPNPRKKRKLDRKVDKRRRTGRNSPDVKDEPISPPPFHDVQPLGSGRPRPAVHNEPIMIDDTPQEVRYVRAPERYVDSPTRPPSRMLEPTMPLSEPRAMSRSTMRPMRDDGDLRRVASLHNMRGEQPRYVERIYESPTQSRSGFHVSADSPVRMEAPRIMQESPIAYEREPSQAIRVVRTPAPGYREIYQDEPEVRYVSQPVAPPPTIERIIVDEYGRKFREIVQERPSVAPRAVSTYVDQERPVYYDNYDRARAGSVMMEPAPEPRYSTEMPPPRIVRQMAEPAPIRREAYESMPPGRAASVAVDRGARQPVYMDEGGEYPPSARMGSVRPPPTRYEERGPVQMLPRAGSVRPTPREGSVFVDDRTGMRREYVQMERPRYQMVEPETRYVDAQGREIIMDNGPEGGRTYVQRY